MDSMKRITFFAAFVVVIIGLFLTGCSQAIPPVDNPPNTNPGGEGNVNFAASESTDKFIQFNSTDEFKDFMQQRMVAKLLTSAGEMGSSGIGASKMVASAESLAPSFAGGATASDYSQTNVQVAGVDEADFVKNDARYIYMIADNQLIIVDAYDAANAKIISKTKLQDSDSADSNSIKTAERSDYNSYVTAKEIFVNNDKLVLFADGQELTVYFEKYDLQPRTKYKQATFVFIYDISNKEKPKLVEKFSSTGYYSKARMIGNYVYFVTQEQVYSIIDLPEPVIKAEMSGKTVSPKLYYFDNPEDSYTLNTITSIDLGKKEVVDSKSLTLGYSNTLMVSENNIYIAYQKQYYGLCWNWRCSYGNNQGYDKERFYDVIVPLLKGSLKTDIDAIISENTDEEAKWVKISAVLSDFYQKAAKDQDMEEEYSDMVESIQDGVDEYDTKKEMENRKTIIHKLEIKEGMINYKAKGDVYGTLLNQFSMDEYDSKLRVATTIDVWTGNARVQNNNVYILDNDMTTIGKLTGIAEKERIYSARFVGTKLYLVTFRQMDPFFVIDLSDTKNPKVLGELKIPGYSDYLHPYDDTHIIGVGKETSENEFGGTTTKGLKIALFDVSDFANPKLVDKVEIGETGTDSPALHDHRAFLFSKTKGILVLPVSEIVEKTRLTEQGYSYRYVTWHGAYVFKVSTNGFEEIGKVKHSSSSNSYYNWFDQASVMRSLYMDNNLYTISNKYIKINDLSKSLEELKTVNLPYEEGYYPRY